MVDPARTAGHQRPAATAAEPPRWGVELETRFPTLDRDYTEPLTMLDAVELDRSDAERPRLRPRWPLLL